MLIPMVSRTQTVGQKRVKPCVDFRLDAQRISNIPATTSQVQEEEFVMVKLLRQWPIVVNHETTPGNFVSRTGSKRDAIGGGSGQGVHG